MSHHGEATGNPAPEDEPAQPWASPLAHHDQGHDDNPFGPMTTATPLPVSQRHMALLAQETQLADARRQRQREAGHADTELQSNSSRRSVRSAEWREMQDQLRDLAESRKADQERIRNLERELAASRLGGTGMIGPSGPTLGQPGPRHPRPSQLTTSGFGQDHGPRPSLQPVASTHRQEDEDPPSLPPKPSVRMADTPIATPYGQWNRSQGGQAADYQRSVKDTPLPPLPSFTALGHSARRLPHEQVREELYRSQQPATTTNPGRSSFPKAKEIGSFNPDGRQGSSDSRSAGTKAYLWWQKVEHFVVMAGYTRQQVLLVLMGCMEGRAETWIASTQPIPITWAEWRKAFLTEFIPSTAVATKELKARHFRPKRNA